jgi:Mg-chelatase subunit ChlD
VAGARTASRAELAARHRAFLQVSPHAGLLDEAAFDAELARAPDDALTLLADLARGTDRDVRAAARALARRLPLRLPRHGRPVPRGTTRLTTVPDAGAGGDVDLDATLARLAVHAPLRADDVRVRAWRRPGRAYLLLLDVSGSVAGARLATAALTVAALALRMRPGDDLAVIAFWGDAVVLRHMGAPVPPAAVVEDVLSLRGTGTTDLALAMRAGLGQLALAGAVDRVSILLSDGVRTAGTDPVKLAPALAPMHVLGLSRDDAAAVACAQLADAGRGRLVFLDGPAGAPEALAICLG